MDTQTLLSRVGHWFRPGMKNGLGDRLAGLKGAETILEGSETILQVSGKAASAAALPGANGSSGRSTGLDGQSAPPAPGRWSRLFSRKKRTARAWSHLEDALSEKLTALERRLTEQQRQIGEFQAIVAAIARDASSWPAAADAHNQRLDGVMETVNDTGERVARWDQTLSKLPDLAENNSQMLSRVLEQVRESEGTARQVERSVTALDQSTRVIQGHVVRSAEAISRIGITTQTAADSARDGFGRMQRWLVVIMIVTAAMTILNLVQFITHSAG